MTNKVKKSILVGSLAVIILSAFVLFLTFTLKDTKDRSPEVNESEKDVIVDDPIDWED